MDMSEEERLVRQKELRRRKRAAARRKRRRQRRRRMICAAAVLVLVIVIAVLAFCGLGGRSSDKTAEGRESGDAVVSSSGDTAVSSDAAESTGSSSGTVTEAEEASGPVTITMSFTGDCTLGTDENFNYSTSLNAYYESYGADYFFEDVRDIFEADDITVVNMEGTLTEETARADKTYAFKGEPEYVQILSGSSVEAANIANNHSHDYGTQSYEDTIETLEDNGISHFGYDDIAYFEVSGVTVGLVGIYELAEGLGVSEQVTENIQTARENGADIVVVSFHWGIEKDSCPDSTQVTLAHQAIDDGADLVIGHHPHVLQGIEYYNGKVIAYSLGNFCFGGNSNPSDKDTMILQMTFTTQDGEITDSELNVIPCSLSSASGYNDYQPTLLTGDAAQEVLDKIASRSQEILSNYDSAESVYESGD